jgi:hypothetical protein
VLVTLAILFLAQTPDVLLVRDQADAAIAILETRARGEVPGPETWARLRATEGYRRLLRREAAMGRTITDSAFQAFLSSDTLPARLPELSRTLEDWSRADTRSAAARALAYLPEGIRLRATIYPVIKPRPNSFVFDTGTDSAAIFLFLDPTVRRAKLENTIAHELHHVGYAGGCPAEPRSPAALGARSAAAREARRWIGAFGEGIAMLAAAGGPDAHPHAESDSAERARWDRDYANVAKDLRSIESFLLDVVGGRLTHPDSIRARAMGFFGDAQGAWYTVGYLMASTIEQVSGRAALLTVICDPLRLMRHYNDVAEVSRRPLPLWSGRLFNRLR